MRRRLTILGLGLAVLALALWASGALAGLEGWIAAAQREVQTVLAGAVRAIRSGEPGALVGLLTVTFGYGVLHAAGPGHGKLVIGAYGMGRRVPVARLLGLALAASLAQAAVAVAIVYAGVALLGWGRDQTEDWAARVAAPIGTAAIGAVGLWLMLRGMRGLWRQAAAGEHQGQDQTPVHDHHGGHSHDHDHHDHAHPQPAVCESCGHAHGPSLAQVAALRGWRDGLALIAGIALRPCSGALFLLILTWQLGIGAAGVAGAFAMGLGTATVTAAVALAAVWAREGALASLPGTHAAARALPWIEAVAGAVVVLAALALLGRSL